LYKILFTRTAEKEYLYLFEHDRPVFERVKRAVHSIAADPTQGKPLKLGLKGKRSYKVGMYRIIYSIAHNILTVYVLDIGHRREIYR